MALRQVDPNGPGWQRVRAGKGFWYRDEHGERIDDADALERIKALAIPPAWEDVWICRHPNGHIQAVGVDARGRRQYRYHEEWGRQRAAAKHDRVVRFARRLPALREQVRADLAKEGMPKERVLACAVRLLELGFFRVGGAEYAAQNGSYGLATLQKRHVAVRGDTIRFDFDAKSGQHRRCEVVDPRVREVVLALRRRRSAATDELLAYRADDGTWIDVSSTDINEYLREHLGDGFTGKDFRTWVGTVLAAVVLADDDDATTPTERRRAVAAAAREVGEHLGNTAAVARSAYIDPRVVERYEAEDILGDDHGDGSLRELEVEVLRLLERGGEVGSPT